MRTTTGSASTVRRISTAPQRTRIHPLEDLSEIREDYARQGYAELGQLLDLDAVATLNEELADQEGRVLEHGDYGVLHNNAWRWHRGFSELIQSGQLAAVARVLLQVSDVVLFQDNLVWKTPGTTTRLEWHQDYSYWPLSEPDGVTLWLALDDANTDNGCLHFLSGTHLLGERQPADFVRGAEQPPIPTLPPLDWQKREHEAVPVPVQAGCLLAHHPLVWHMSPANLSNRHRRAFATTWLSSRVRWNPDHAPHPFNHELDARKGDPVTGENFPQFREV